MAEIPSLFVSHGAPSMLLEPDSPARQFLGGLGETETPAFAFEGAAS